MPSDTTTEQVPLDERPVQIPPAFEVFIGKLKGDRKKLMKDKAFGASADQLRGFIGTFTYPRFTELVRLFASGIFETYSLAASNAQQLRQLHGFVTDEFDHVRSELDDIDLDRRGVNPAILDEFQQAFYGLGSVLKEKLPGDEETEAAYNRCTELLAEVMSDLLGSERDYRDDDDRDDEDDGDDDPPTSGSSAPEEESSEKEPPEKEPPVGDGEE